MRVTPTVFSDPAVLGRALAEVIAAGCHAAARRGEPYLLGCPGGRSAHSTYVAVADLVAEEHIDLRPLVVVMMDEYVERDPSTGGFRRITPSLPHSCTRFGRVEIVDRLDRAAGPGRGMSPDRFWVPDPAQPDAYDKQIADHGGIDLFLLASGASDGHVAFNPAGSPADSRTRVVPLAEATRRDNLATFPSFDGRLDDVPSYGVTVGVGTILEQSKRVVMVAHGSDKAATVQRMRTADHYDPAWPATVVADCADPQLFIDSAAAQA